MLLDSEEWRWPAGLRLPFARISSYIDSRDDTCHSMGSGRAADNLLEKKTYDLMMMSLFERAVTPIA